MGRRIFLRPELGAVVGAVLVFLFFAIVAGDRGFLTKGGTINYLEVAAELGILTTAVTLLAIAGEFDLSIGSMIGAAGMVVAIATTKYHVPVGLALLMAFALALGVGFMNGYLVVKTRLPSFIVTLAALFILRGATIGVTALLTNGSLVGGVNTAAGDGPIVTALTGKVAGFPVTIAWWLGLAALATWVLMRTRFGNWIFACGGDEHAARKLGVAVGRVKILLFMGTACVATLVAAITVLTSGSADVLRGNLKEFQAITAVVIGGTLLTGGYGTVIGAAFGALIFGMVNQGIFFTDLNSDWFQVFVGVMLLAAMLVNRVIQQKAQERR